MLLYPRKTAILESTRPSNQGYLTIYSEIYTPGNSHPNGTVKANANINSKQTTLKAMDNYVYTYLLCFMSLLYVFYSISAIMDDKKSLI